MFVIRGDKNGALITAAIADSNAELAACCTPEMKAVTGRTNIATTVACINLVQATSDPAGLLPFPVQQLKIQEACVRLSQPLLLPKGLAPVIHTKNCQKATVAQADR
jgi:hypothetical protein